jgi:hypothetical protein
VSASAGAQPEVDTEIGAIRNLSVPPAPPPSASGAGSSVSPAPLSQRREASRERLRTDNALNRLTAPATQAKDAAGSRALPADPLEGAIARLRDAGASAPALESWAQVLAAARGRWLRPIEGARPRGAEVRSPQGTLLGWLSVESSQVRWQAVHEGSVWQVDVPAALAERLRAALLP